MIKKIFLIFCCTIFCFNFVGCKKSNQVTTVPITSLKGNITLMVKTLHHGLLLPNLKVYLKLNTSSYPGNNITDYNYSAITNANGEATFTQMPLGKVWLYATGYDASVSSNVYGNLGYIISSANVDSNNITNAEVYVTE
jgi:hypothetical protein